MLKLTRLSYLKHIETSIKKSICSFMFSLLCKVYIEMRMNTCNDNI